MAFVSEEIITEEDKKYFNSIGFTYLIDGTPLEAYWWAIDKERNIVLTCRGGVAYESTMGYELCIEGKLVKMYAREETEGSRFKNNLKIHWFISKIEAPKELYEREYNDETIKECIEEAFIGWGTSGMERSKIQAVSVKIDAEIEKV